MKKIALALSPLALLMLGGCASDPCAEANFKLDDPKVCLKMPAGFKAEKAAPFGDGKYVRIQGPQSEFAVRWKPGNQEKEIDNLLATQTSGNPTIKGKGEVPGRKGKFFYVEYPGGNMGLATVYMQGEKHFFECFVNQRKAEMAPLVEACKTMWVK